MSNGPRKPMQIDLMMLNDMKSKTSVGGNKTTTNATPIPNRNDSAKNPARADRIKRAKIGVM